MTLTKNIKQEIQKCIDSPYYFATTYMTVKDGEGKVVKYSTVLSEEEFNKQFKNKVINIKFKGVDNWNRPVFKDVDSNTYYGSVNKLFNWETLPEEVIKYFKLNIDELEYFGSHFGCEPNGGLSDNITLNIVE